MRPRPLGENRTVEDIARASEESIPMGRYGRRAGIRGRRCVPRQRAVELNQRLCYRGRRRTPPEHRTTSAASHPDSGVRSTTMTFSRSHSVRVERLLLSLHGAHRRARSVSSLGWRQFVPLADLRPWTGVDTPPGFHPVSAELLGDFLRTLAGPPGQAITSSQTRTRATARDHRIPIRHRNALKADNTPRSSAKQRQSQRGLDR